MNPSQEHQDLIKAAIATFSSQGYSIIEAANINGYPSPQAHGGYEPDIVMRDNSGKIHLVEAKTGNDLTSEGTKNQLLAFSNRIMPTDSPLSGQVVPFHIIVRHSDLPTLSRVLDELGLSILLGTRVFIHWLS